VEERLSGTQVATRQERLVVLVGVVTEVTEEQQEALEPQIVVAVAEVTSMVQAHIMAVQEL
jgi:hypothetical protein